MAYTTINDPTDYFNTKLYTGNGGTNAVTGVGFQPDWVWLKDRTSANSHGLFDVIRGATNALLSNTTNATVTNANYLQSFDSDGFTLGSEGAFNTNTNNYTSWNWLASNTTASNTDGSITSTVSTNTTSGFSIVSYTGTGSAGTVGHGLNSAPSMIINKKYNTTENWFIYHKSLGNNKSIQLNSTAASYTSGNWGNTDPTSSVFSLSTTDSNTSGATYINYCFSEKQGYSKFGSYTGNGSTDGPFIWTGFKPSFLLIKRTDAAYHWYIHDNKRNPFNVMDKELYPSQANAEGTAVTKDFLSNGIKIRGTQVSQNASGGSYIYMAFAESPFTTSTGVPTTAR